MSSGAFEELSHVGVEGGLQFILLFFRDGSTTKQVEDRLVLFVLGLPISLLDRVFAFLVKTLFHQVIDDI